MKASEVLALLVVVFGVAVAIGIRVLFPAAPWFVYAGVAVGVLLAVPKVIEDAAKRKIATQVVDSK